LINLDKVYHGIATPVKITKKDLLFNGLPQSFQVGRYHSWIVSSSLPEVLEATSVDNKGQLMSLRHKTYNVRSVQYHPESILTPYGKKILENWINSSK
jgi:anthranilate synthase component 2